MPTCPFRIGWVGLPESDYFIFFRLITFKTLPLHFKFRSPNIECTGFVLMANVTGCIIFLSVRDINVELYFGHTT